MCLATVNTLRKMRGGNRGWWLEEIMQHFCNHVFCLVLSGQKGSIPLGMSSGGLSIKDLWVREGSFRVTQTYILCYFLRWLVSFFQVLASRRVRPIWKSSKKTQVKFRLCRWGLPPLFTGVRQGFRCKTVLTLFKHFCRLTIFSVNITSNNFSKF